MTIAYTDTYSVESVNEEIAERFALLRKVPAHCIAVPCAEHSGASLRVTDMSLSRAIRDLVTEGCGNEQLMAALHKSECPLVQALRDVLCAEWQKQWSADIADARQE